MKLGNLKGLPEYYKGKNADGPYHIEDDIGVVEAIFEERTEEIFGGCTKPASHASV